MRKLLAVTLLIGLLALVAGAKDPITGFRGVVWGSAPCADMQEQSIDPSFGGVTRCSRDEDMHIGDAELTEITYGYWQNQLLTVVLQFSGYTNFSGVLEAMNAKYGRGVQTNKYIETYLWNTGPGSGMLKYNEILNTGEVVLFSDELAKQADAYAKKRAKQGAADF